jgi:hypothetical protein
LTTSEAEVVFNVVWTGPGFTYLRYFVASQLCQSEARFRFVANDCPPDQIALMRGFAERHPQVIEVIDVSSSEMIPHGEALDRVRDLRDDGRFFCFIDPDIKARGPFLRDFLDRLAGGCSAVTSGRGVWCESDVVPPGHPGVAGEHFYSQDGYVYGSPHFAMYERDALDATTDRWHVGFGSRGPDLDEKTRGRLTDVGHEYWLYDTGKIVNILLQEDGHPLCHLEHPQLIHIGGMSHYLSTNRHVRAVAARFEVAQYSAAVLRDLSDGEPARPLPVGLDPSLTERLTMVREELIDLVRSYDAYVRDSGD